MANYRFYISILFLIAIFVFKIIIQKYLSTDSGLKRFITEYDNILLIVAITWFSIETLRYAKKLFLKQFDISKEDNLSSRKVYTQVGILEKVLIMLILVFAVGLILLSFDGIRQIGIGLFASAGVAGIILGLSAQKMMGTLLAGVQIALTQPFRIDDAVVVEGEWGWIEEIHLTYVVVKIWDMRRLVLPSTYFLEKPFQNWTRTSAEIIGSVFLYTDYTVPIESLRKELTRLLNESPLWDKKTNVLQVTDSKESTMEMRILVSAKNSPSAWDLRVHIREKMIEFIQQNYPDCLPKTRVALKQNEINP